MSESKRVSFCLVPFVSLYKRRAKMDTPVLTATAPPSYSCCSSISGVEEPHRNEIVENASSGGQPEVKPLIPDSVLPPPLTVGPPAPLSIRAVQHQDLRVEDVPDYAASPMSPATLTSLAEMRVHEEQLRKAALTEALTGFHEQPTPPHHRTPASSVQGSSSDGGAISPLAV